MKRTVAADKAKHWQDLAGTYQPELKLAQKFLGHSSVATTADICTHVSETMECEAADALERSIFGNVFLNVLNLRTEHDKTVN